jgi:hypothetical protein
MRIQWDSASAITDLKKVYDSDKREVLYNFLLEIGIPEKLARIIKMCLNETCSKIRVSKHLFNTFPTQNGLKQDELSPLLFNFALELPSGKSKKMKSFGILIC